MPELLTEEVVIEESCEQHQPKVMVESNKESLDLPDAPETASEA